MSTTELTIRSAGSGSTLGQADDRPLTDQEVQLVQRLLSDPFSFPLAFKSWLIGYLETSDMTLPMSSVMGLQSTLGISGAAGGTLGILPAGLIFPYAGGTAPAGAAMCDGASYSTTVESRLFSAIGYTYGGSGGTFNVPDIRERIPVGKGSIAAHDTLGKTEGAGLGQRGAQHKHSVLQDVIGWDSEGTQPGSINLGNDQTPRVGGGEMGNHGHNVRVGPQGAVPTDTPAFITVNFIIVK